MNQSPESILPESVSFDPIGYVHCDRKYRYETPRQGVLASGSKAVIELLPHKNYEQAVKDLGDFERIWVIYLFHHNRSWRPLVNVPRHRTDKVGVFATRAPYRPNPIGMSCVQLLDVRGLEITIGEVDLLDGTPVLDIKPYLPYADSFPDARTGWVKDALSESYGIHISDLAGAQLDWLLERSGVNLRGFILVQLQNAPTDGRRKRVAPDTALIDRNSTAHILSYRTWRIFYSVDEQSRTVNIAEIRSGYTSTEILQTKDDPYSDKTLHTEFLKNYPAR